MKSLSPPAYLLGPLLAALYFGVAWVFEFIRLKSGLPAMFWLPHGLALGAFLVYGLAIWPWIAVGSVLFNTTTVFPSASVPFLVVGNLAGPALGALLCRRMIADRLKLHSLQSFLLFILLALGIAGLIGSGAEVLSISFFTSSSASLILPRWLDWWLDEALGALLIVPPWIALVNEKGRVSKELKRWDFHAPLLFLCVILVGLLSYTPLANFNPTILIRPYLLFPFMIWAAIRYGIMGVSLALGITCFCLTIGLLSGTIPGLVGRTPNDEVTFQQCLVLVLGITGHVIASVLKEKTEALEARDTFLSIASHEIKTPLTSLKLQTHMARKLVAESASPELERAKIQLERAEQQISRLNRLVDDMLDISRISSGKLTLRPERFDLKALVDEVTGRMKPLLEAAGCELDCQMKEPIEGYWDRFRLEQVLLNLLTNAARYGAGKPVIVETRKQGKMAEIRVRDHGRGIAPGDQARIFLRFERVAETDGSGLGLGLYIVQEVLALHGGTVRVESEIGQGATFVVQLPLA